MSAIDAKPRHHWFHVPFQIIVGAFCVYWYLHPPAPNKAVLILTGVTVVMALLDMGPTHKAVYLILVVCLMFIENHAINKERADYAREEASRREQENQRFLNIANELARSTRRSHEQFTATMSRFDENVKMITGGNSFCYLAFSNPRTAQSMLVAVHKGKYPLHDINIRIVDINKFLNANAPNHPPTLESVMAGSTSFRVDTFSKGQSQFLGNYSLASGERMDFNIFFLAMNGTWTEKVQLQKVNGMWKEALKVTSTDGKKLIFKQVEPGFPTAKNGEVAWKD